MSIDKNTPRTLKNISIIIIVALPMIQITDTRYRHVFVPLFRRDHDAPGEPTL